MDVEYVNEVEILQELKGTMLFLGREVVLRQIAVFLAQRF